MTALALDRKTDKYDTDDTVAPRVLDFPVKGSTTLYGGGMIGIDTSGRAVPAAATPSLKICGVAPTQVVNSSVTDGYKRTDVQQGAFFFDTPSSGANQITAAHVLQLCYASDDHTVNLTDGAGQYPVAGVIVGVRADGQVAVFLGQASVWDTTTEAVAASTAFRVRAVITVALAAYTVTAGVITADANGAIGAVADGVTLVAGDLVLLPEGIAATAADAGPYVVTAIGAAGAKFVLTRPDWWAHGSIIPQSAVISVGPSGAVYEGSDWKSFVTTLLKVVGTDAPLLWPRNFRKTITLVAGTVTVGASSFLALRSTAKSSVQVTSNTPNTTTNTTEYAAKVADRVAGAIGTGSLIVFATVAAGTINVADVSTLDLLVTNW